MTDSRSKEQKAVTWTSLKLVLLAVTMFAFCLWVMPPLYTLFCEVTGLNGKTKGQYEAVEVKVDTSRKVKVQFVSKNNAGMPWAFAPKQQEIEVHPGQPVTTFFVAENPTDKYMVGQAVPSMVPHNATDFFHKTECFCFNQQVLAPGETAELGLQFIVDQEVPKGVNRIVLSYTLFDVSDKSPAAIEKVRKAREQQEQDAATGMQEQARRATDNKTSTAMTAYAG